MWAEGPLLPLNLNSDKSESLEPNLDEDACVTAEPRGQHRSEQQTSGTLDRTLADSDMRGFFITQMDPDPSP